MPLKVRRLLLLISASYTTARCGFLRAPWGFEADCERAAASAAAIANQVSANEN